MLYYLQSGYGIFAQMWYTDEYNLSITAKRKEGIAMHPDKKTMRNLFLVAGGVVVLIWLILDTARAHMMFTAVWGLISPFVFGAMLAFVFNVPMRAIENQLMDIKKPGLRRALSILITLFLLGMVLVFVVELLLPQLEKTFESLMVTIPAFAKRTMDSVVGFLNEHPELNDLVNEHMGKLQHIDWGTLLQKAAQVVADGISSIIGSAFTAIGSLSSALIRIFAAVVFSVYCLGRKETLATQGRRILYALIPEPWADQTVRIMRLTNVTFSNFISGQCLEACILGGMFAVSMLIFRMPYVPLVSVIIAVTALVPVVGAFAGCVLGAFFILVDDPVKAMSFVIMFLVLQQIENDLIYPRVVGTSIGLPGMWVLVAVTIGGELMGVLGMLVFIPMASVLYVLLGEFTDRRLSQRNISAEKLMAQPSDQTTRLQQKREQNRQARALRARKKAERRQNKP